MGAFKKYDGSVWQSINPKQLKGIPYTGTLPAVLAGTKAGYLHRYKIYGNTEQTGGTPTPENPIEPSGCGERTGNLLDIASTSEPGYISDGGILFPSALVTTYDYIDVTGNTEVSYKAFTLTSGNRGTIRIAYYDENKSFLSRYVQTNMALQWTTVTLPSDCVYVRLSLDNNLSDIMFTAGSTPPTSYIPYGYKLPILSNSTVTDIYLGEVPTTRRIKKLVLNGTEPWYASSNKSVYYTNESTSLNPSHLSGICTRFVYHFVNRVSNLAHGEYLIDQINKFTWFRNNDIANLQDWKAWLAQQYAAGTPVTVWYVLAEPETAVVNEPLMKIGDYADTVSMEQADVSIPTAAGSTTISWAGQGLEPSEFDSIQEWVDIPTYKRVNGEWVADN